MNARTGKVTRNSGCVKENTNVMKQKPLLVYVTRHKMLPEIAAMLTGYEILHLPTRYTNPFDMVAGIAAACTERPPNVIMWIMPYEWLTTFILLVRQQWPGTERPAIVHPVTYGGEFVRRFTIHKLNNSGLLKDDRWFPQGPVDRKRQMQISAAREQRKAIADARNKD